MAKLGPGVRIDLDPTLPGVRKIKFHPETKNTKAISVEKRHLNSLSKISTIQDKPVVYLLLHGNQPRYTGMSYSALNRLRTHSTKKSDWDRVLIFYSVIPPLNNSITGYCEYKLYVRFQDGGISLDQQKPSEISLSEDDLHVASSFLSDTITILRALGVNLERVISKPKRTFKTTNESDKPSVELTTISDMILQLKAKKTEGTAVYLDPEIRVEEGAIGAFPKPSLKKSESLYRTYKEMKQTGAIQPLEDKPGYWRLTQPYIFSSPSAAASILKGSPQNGWICWMNDQRILLRDLLKQKTKV